MKLAQFDIYNNLWVDHLCFKKHFIKIEAFIVRSHHTFGQYMLSVVQLLAANGWMVAPGHEFCKHVGTEFATIRAGSNIITISVAAKKQDKSARLDVRGPPVKVRVNMPDIGALFHAYEFRVHDLTQRLGDVDAVKKNAQTYLRDKLVSPIRRPSNKSALGTVTV